MLVVKYYNYSAADNKYIADFIFCESIQVCSDGNIKLLACSLNDEKPDCYFIIKASQLISIRVKDGE